MFAFFTDTSLVEAGLLLATFVLCSLIGIERQVRQKSAGYRTHVLVGLGSCAFTLVSAYGFAFVREPGAVLDPSRIAAQIVSGIGFLGAGVIFKGRDVVRGLTTAATIWVSAAVGMACGAGMVSLGVVLTIFHLITLFIIAPAVRRIPSVDRNRVMHIDYADGQGCCGRSSKSPPPWGSAPPSCAPGEPATSRNRWYRWRCGFSDAIRCATLSSRLWTCTASQA
ncbi:MgtC/SapB family protein [Pseudarthrobacter sp. So.54]